MASELIVSAWRGHERFADWLVREMDAKTIVDLGVDLGFSSFVFARATNGGTVYGIDSFEGDIHVGERNTYEQVVAKREELGIKNVELIKGYFSEVANTWDKPIDILHIDGRHEYEDVKEDYEVWSKFVRPGGVILLHDTTVFRSPYEVHRFFAEIDLPKTNFTHSNGLGVVSSDASLIAKIEREHKIWLVSKPAWHFAQRVGRKLRKMAFGEVRPEF